MSTHYHSENVELHNIPNIYENGYESVEVWRVENDVNGNSRYVFHWLSFAREGEWYDDVVKRLQKRFGVRKYRAKWFGGGIVMSGGNLTHDLTQMHQATYAENV